MPDTASEPRRRLPRPTLRLRLTLLYGSLFLLTGTALLAITYVLVREQAVGPKTAPVRITSGTLAVPGPDAVFSFTNGPDAGLIAKLSPDIPPGLRASAAKLQVEAQQQVTTARNSQLASLLTVSGIALAVMAIVSIGLGWLMAGRALAPVRTMSARVRRISEHNLHERLELQGRDDELQELADTFDGLLERLEVAFESQRRFVANASHELRTPITLERTLVEVALADPDADVESLRDTCERVLAAGEQQERLIAALLTLARGQRGLASRHELDLAASAAEAASGAAPNGVTVRRELHPAPTTGDPALVERLVENLVANATQHNVERGWVSMWTGVSGGRAVLRVQNTGPVIDPDDIERLLAPFERLHGERRADGGGLGLGLSIVDAIATTHGAALSVQPRAGGGLDVEVSFPLTAEPAPAGVAYPVTRWRPRTSATS